MMMAKCNDIHWMSYDFAARNRSLRGDDPRNDEVRPVLIIVIADSVTFVLKISFLGFGQHIEHFPLS